MKTEAQYFADWEESALGFGYGTGDPHILEAIKKFFEITPEEGCYDSQQLEAALTPATVWLLINLFCHEDMIEYGTSPRSGWLTTSGKAMKVFVEKHSVAELESFMRKDEVSCYKDYCNCPVVDCRPKNIFWFGS